MTNEEIELELRHLATEEELAQLRADLHRDFGDFRVQMSQEFGNFKADVFKTLWITQLSVAGVILVGIGLIANLALGPINSQLASLSNQVQAISARLPQKP